MLEDGYLRFCIVSLEVEEGDHEKERVKEDERKYEREWKKLTEKLREKPVIYCFYGICNVTFFCHKKPSFDVMCDRGGIANSSCHEFIKSIFTLCGRLRFRISFIGILLIKMRMKFIRRVKYLFAFILTF